MNKLIAAATAAILLSACATAEPVYQASQTSGEPVQVMILGTFHFDNPGLDIVNMEADDMLSAHRQAELALLADQLSAFKPTAIAVESTRRENFLDVGYKSFEPEDLSTDRNEIVQIGYRVAQQQGIDRVYAVDEYEGEISFFPFDRAQKFAEENGKTELIEHAIERVRSEADAMMQDQATTSISELLARHNDPETTNRMHADFYYALFGLANEASHPDAELNYGWYARNALIFSNIAMIARPGDRILVIYGAGHNYWLRHFVEVTPGFELIEPAPFLMDQATDSEIANGS